MINQLSKQQQKGLALFLLGVVLIVFIQIVIAPPIALYNSKMSEVDDLRFKLAKYQQAVGNKKSLETKLVSLRNNIDEAQLYQAGVAPGVVAANLQNKVRQLVETLGASIISTQVLTEKIEKKLVKVAISVRLTVKDKQLEELLYQLESSQPVLFIDKLSIATSRRPETKTLKHLPLNLSLELSTYIYKREQ